MSTVLLTDAARGDMLEIWQFVARDNPTAADQLISNFHEKFEKLAFIPTMARSVDSLADGLRVFPIDSYLIFCRPTNGGTAIVRVIHGMRDILPEFFQ